MTGNGDGKVQATPLTISFPVRSPRIGGRPPFPLGKSGGTAFPRVPLNLGTASQVDYKSNELEYRSDWLYAIHGQYIIARMASDTAVMVCMFDSHSSSNESITGDGR